MKEIEVYVFGLLLAMVVSTVTGCNNKGNSADNIISAIRTQITTQGITTEVGESSGAEANDSNGTDDADNESSMGVIGDIVGDVRRDINSVADGTLATTNSSDKTTK